MKVLFFLFPALLAGPILFAQNSILKGSVVDSADVLLPGASIVLYAANDSSDFRGVVTDLSGHFEIQTDPGYYRVKVSYIGFNSVYKDILLDYEEVSLGKIVLKENSIYLNEIVVTGKRLPVILRGDTVEINAGAYKSNPDADASDILGKMPTITNNNGRIQAEGEEVRKVLVDGKPFFGNDPNAALKSLPAEVIDKIQIFDDRSDQSKLTGFDDGNTEKTINIITKKEFRNGQFGHVSGGYGTDDRYRFNGLLNAFKDDQRITVVAQTNNINQQNFGTADLAGVTSGSSNGRGGGRGRRGGGGSVGGDAGDFLVGEQNGIVTTQAVGINYTDEITKKLSLNASYFYNRTENDAATSLERNYFSDSLPQQYQENERAYSTNENHRFNVRMKYDLDSFNTFIYTPSLSLQRYDGLSNQSTATLLNNELISRSDNNFGSELLTYNLQNRLFWQYKFRKEGRTLSIDASQTYYPTEGDNELASQINGERSTKNLDQQSTLNQLNEVYEGRLRYTEPLTQKLLLRLDYEPQLQLSQSDKLTYSQDTLSDSYTVLQTDLSNSFESQYTVQEAGAGLLYRPGKGNFFMFNTDYQYATLRTEQAFPATYGTSRNYSAILPMIMWRYQPSKNSNLRVRLRADTEVPQISQLQGVLNNTNPQQLYIGNPNLDQQYEYDLSVRYNRANPAASSSLFMMMRGNFTNNYIGTSSTIAGRDSALVDGIWLVPGTQLAQPVNLDGYYNLQMFGIYGFPIDSTKLNLNINLSAQWSRIPGLINNEPNYTHNPGVGLGLTASSNVSEKIDFTVSTNSAINYSLSTLSPERNTQFFNQTSTAKLYWNIWKGLVYRTSLSHQYFAGLSQSYDAHYLLWGMGIAYKFMKDKRAEVGAEIFDILKQNQNISRNTTETYYEDRETNALRQYVMFTFRYNFGRYNVAK